MLLPDPNLAPQDPDYPINLPPADLACPAGNSFSVENTDRNVSMQSQGGTPILPSQGSHMLQYTVQYSMRPATKHTALAREIPDVNRTFHFQGQLSHQAPDLVSLFFFSFVYCFVSCLPPCLTICPTVAAATCHGPIQNSKTTTFFFLLWRRGSTSRYRMPLPAFGLALRRAARVSAFSSANPFPSVSHSLSFDPPLFLVDHNRYEGA